MTEPNPADAYERWQDAYETVWQHPTRLTATPCPSCGHLDLRLLFVAFSGSSSAVMPAFWCDACRRGLPPTRGVLPPWATSVQWESVDLPDYRLVVPEESE